MKKSLLTVLVLSFATLLVAGCMNNNIEEENLEGIVSEEEVVVDFDVEDIEDEAIIEDIEDEIVAEDVELE